MIRQLDTGWIESQTATSFPCFVLIIFRGRCSWYIRKTNTCACQVFVYWVYSTYAFPDGNYIWYLIVPGYFLCAPAKWRQATINFVMSVRSVRPSVRMERLSFHWTDLDETWYLRLFWKYIEKAQVLLKADKNHGYFIWRCLKTFSHL